MNLNRRSVLVSGLATGVALAAPSIIRAQGLPKIRMQAQAGSIDAISVLIMQNMGIDKKFGFEGTFEVLTAEGANQNFLMGNSDVTFDNDIMGVAIARNEDFPITCFYPVSNMHPSIVVRGNSDIMTPTDLKGRKVGHFGEFSGTTMFLRYIVNKSYGFDIMKECDMVQIGPGALGQMLAAGDIDAMLNFETYISEAVSKANARILLQGYKAFMAETNGVFSPWIVNMVAREDWLKENPALAYAVCDAWDEVLLQLNNSKYEILREPYILEALPVLRQPEVLDSVIKLGYETPYWTNKWDRPAIDAGNAFLKEMAAGGQSIDTAPDGVMVMLEDFVGPRP